MKESKEKFDKMSSDYEGNPRDSINWRINFRNNILDCVGNASKEEEVRKISGIKPKSEHDIDRAKELVSGILKCKQANMPPPIGVVTELNSMLQYKVDSTQA